EYDLRHNTLLVRLPPSPICPVAEVPGHGGCVRGVMSAVRLKLLQQKSYARDAFGAPVARIPIKRLRRYCGPAICRNSARSRMVSERSLISISPLRWN